MNEFYIEVSDGSYRSYRGRDVTGDQVASLLAADGVTGTFVTKEQFDAAVAAL